jgi:hypothetical protein
MSNPQFSDRSLCPACGMHLPFPRITRCAWSRFVSRYVCSTCGRREALEGFFWREKATQQRLRLHAHVE